MLRIRLLKIGSFEGMHKETTMASGLSFRFFWGFNCSVWLYRVSPGSII